MCLPERIMGFSFSPGASRVSTASAYSFLAAVGSLSFWVRRFLMVVMSVWIQATAGA